MRILDFISQSPQNYIFQKESNKTTLGGTLFLIYAFICIGIFLFYLLDYLNNDKYYIQYTFNYNFIDDEELKKKLNDKEYNPYIEYLIFLRDENDEILSNNFILALRKERKHTNGPGLRFKQFVSEIEVDILYKCKSFNDCSLRTEDKRLNYFIDFGYSYKYIFHQNSTFPPVQELKDTFEMKRFEFSFINVIKKNLDWQIFKYKDVGGLFSTEKDYIGGTIKSGDIFVHDSYYVKNLTTINETDPYAQLYTLKVNYNFDYYEEYVRTKSSWLTIFANSFSLWMSLYSGIKMVFAFLYAQNFNNYKIIQDILSKDEKMKTKKENSIELNSDFKKLEESIDKKTINEKNIITKDELINNKENLIENSDEYRTIKNEDDSLIFPRLNLFDYLFNNLYFSQKCLCDYKKQRIISTSNQILYKYFSVENIIYNQIKIENLLKDYRWNNLQLKNIQNNELIIQLESYLFDI